MFRFFLGSDFNLSKNYISRKTVCMFYIKYDEKTKRYSSQFKVRIVEQESYINVMRPET